MPRWRVSAHGNLNGGQTASSTTQSGSYADFRKVGVGTVQEMARRANPRRLRVSCPPSFGARWLLPRIGRFVATNPDIDLDISASNTHVDFNRDDVDVAIRYGLGHWPGVAAEHLTDDAFFPVCSPHIANGPPKRPEDLANYTLLRAEDEYWKPWFEAAGLDLPEPDRGTTFGDSSHLLQAAADGQGVVLARRTLIGKDLRNGVLVRPFEVEVAAPRRFYFVYPPRLKDSPKLASFRRWLTDEIDCYNDASMNCVPRPPALKAAQRARKR